MNFIQSLIEKAIANSDDVLTFDASKVETKKSKTGNVGLRVVTDQGKTITFWASTADAVVEQVPGGSETQWRVVPGTSVLEDGGLIAKDAQAGGFWD